MSSSEKKQNDSQSVINESDLKNLAKIPKNRRDLPATMGLLLKVRAEIKAEFRSLDNRHRSFEKRFVAIDKRFAEIDKRFEAIDKRFAAIDKRFEAIDKRFEAIDKRFAAIDKRFEAIDQRFEALEQKMDAGFKAIDAKIDKLIEVVHSRMVIAEQQHSEHRILYDALALHTQQLREHSQMHQSHEATFRLIAKAQKKNQSPSTT